VTAKDLHLIEETFSGEIFTDNYVATVLYEHYIKHDRLGFCNIKPELTRIAPFLFLLES
jgi:hypothetical protein